MKITFICTILSVSLSLRSTGVDFVNAEKHCVLILLGEISAIQMTVMKVLLVLCQYWCKAIIMTIIAIIKYLQRMNL